MLEFTRWCCCVLMLFALSAVTIATSEPQIVRMPFVRRNTSSIVISRRQYISPLVHDIFPGGGYYITANVGTPGQTVQLQIDTGSSDVWVFGPGTQCGPTTCDGGSFDSSQSSTFKLVRQGGFGIQYGSGKVIGDVVSETFVFGGITLSGLQLAVATQAENEPTGIMGIGYDTNEATISNGGSQYPSVVDQMVSQGWIQTRAYSLYLNDLEASTGEVIFGGFDTAKFKGNLIPLPVLSDKRGGFSELAVVLNELVFVFKDQTTAVLNSAPLAAILDSGTTLMQLPPDVFQALAQITNIVYNQDADVYLIDCRSASYPGGLAFQFGDTNGPVIDVLFRELVLQQIATASGVPLCVFGAFPSNGAGNGVAILGDTFLRSAYVLYDLDSNIIALAQTVFNSQDSKLFGLGPDSTGLNPIPASTGAGPAPSESQPLPSPSASPNSILTPAPSSPPSVSVGPPGPHSSLSSADETPTVTQPLPIPPSLSTLTLPTTLEVPSASFGGPNPIPPSTLTAVSTSAIATGASGGGISASGIGGSTITSVFFITPTGGAGVSAGTTTAATAAATQGVSSDAIGTYLRSGVLAAFLGFFWMGILLWWLI